jgi:hypothetical protein
MPLKERKQKGTPRAGICAPLPLGLAGDNGIANHAPPYFSLKS